MELAGFMLYSEPGKLTECKGESFDYVNLDRKLLSRYLGRKGKRTIFDTSSRNLVEGCLPRCISMARNAAMVKTYPVAGLDPAVIALENGPFLQSKLLSRQFKGVERVSLFIVTIGTAVEDEVEELFRRGNMAKAVISDAVASALVEQYADLVNRRVTEAAAAIGFRTTTRFSPGYGDWDLEVQPRILESLEAWRIGVTCTDGFMLQPQKSITAAVGWISGRKG